MVLSSNRRIRQAERRRYDLTMGGGSWFMGAGINPRAAYDPVSAPSLAASYVNVFNPGTNNAAPGVAPTHAQGTGWTFNGTTQWLTTGLIVESGWSMFVKFSGVTNNGRPGGMVIDVNRRLYIIPDLGGTSVQYANAGAVSVAPRLLAGNLGVAGTQGYRNGVPDGAAMASWVGTNGTRAIYIGATNNAGTAGNFLAGVIAKLIIFDVVLNAAQAASLYARM